MRGRLSPRCRAAGLAILTAGGAAGAFARIPDAPINSDTARTAFFGGLFVFFDIEHIDIDRSKKAVTPARNQ